MAEITENRLEPKVCESCGESFGCGAKIEGCWCVGLEMPEQVTIDL